MSHQQSLSGWPDTRKDLYSQRKSFSRFVRVERNSDTLRSFLHQNLNPCFRFLQLALAFRTQLHPRLKKSKTFFQWEIAPLQFFYNALQLVQARFEVRRGWFLLRHRPIVATG